jgi:uncharacterized membrane protein
MPITARGSLGQCVFRVALAGAVVAAVSLTVSEGPVAATPVRAAVPAMTWRVLPATAAWSVPLKILNNGTVVGNENADNEPTAPAPLSGGSAWEWSRGRFRLLGARNAQASTAFDVSSNGIVAGSVLVPAPGGHSQNVAVRWVAGHAVAVLPGDTADSWATAVNTRGDVLVDYQDGPVLVSTELITATARYTLLPQLLSSTMQTGISVNSRDEAIVRALGTYATGSDWDWRRGTATEIPDYMSGPGSNACISSITDTGYVAWSSYDSTLQRSRAWVRHDGSDTPLPDSGLWAEVACNPQAVNAEGDAVGMIGTPGGTRQAVLWRHGTLIPLVTDPLEDSQAIAVNDHDEVVAEESPAQGGAGQWFLWVAGHRLALPVPTGFSSVTPTAMNKLGQVVGYATRDDANGSPEGSRAVVWTRSPAVRSEY